MIRAGVRADKRQQGMIAGSHFSSLFSLSFRRGLREKIYLLQHGRGIYLCPEPPRPPPLSKNTFLMKSFIRCAAENKRFSSEGRPAGGEACHARVCLRVCLCV